MATIKEDYVSFETAKLLKEKGFNERLLTLYITNESKKEGCFQLMAFTDDKIDNNHSDHCYLAPTLQMAMKWLRKEHNIDIEVHADVGMLGVKVYTPFISRYKSFTEYPSKLRQYKNGLYFEDDRGIIPGIRYFETYEEAVEAAIKYCIENLI